MPRCSRVATDPSRSGALCETHLSAIEDTDGDRDAHDDQDDRESDAFSVAIEFFHDRLDDPLPDTSEHTTARNYFTDGRGWNVETIEDKCLGYAPADETALLDGLMREGYDRETILGTGLFTEELKPLWRGRYVFPYFGTDGRPCYAISRSADHPADWFRDQKYAKAVKSKDYSRVDEPIYGLETIRDGRALLITEGMADAISAHEAGYPCVSPVTTQFKNTDRERLLDAIDERDVSRVCIVQDAERPPASVDENGTLTLEQHGEGLRGAVSTATFLTEHGTDARIVELPRLGLDKVDLDDYLTEWATDGDLRPLLTSAKPASQHPAYTSENATRATERAGGTERTHPRPKAASGTQSALFDLSIEEATGLSAGHRGTNPLGHHGDSKNYFVIDDGCASDFKYKATYTALTYLLCEAGERSPRDPEGSLSDHELLVAWSHAKRTGHIADDDPIPHRALVSAALDAGLCERSDVEDGWKLPLDAFNDALETVRNAHGLDPGRPPLTGGGSGSGRAPGPRQFCEECEPPLTAHAEPLDVDARREEMLGAAYDRFIETDELTLWAYNPGEGKTTCGTAGAAERERPFVVALPKHENCREFQLDETKPDGCFHLKGAAQPVGDECMDASIDDRECHDHPETCPSMCPVYDLDKDHPKRVLFDVFAAVGKSRKAHALLGLYDEPWHGESCEWLDQWDAIEHVDRIVTVHQYLRLKSIREHGDVLIDDIGGGFTDEETVTFDSLARCRQALRKYARYAKGDDERVADTLRLLEMFVDDLLDELADGAINLRALDAPNFPATTRTYDSRAEIPDHVDEADISKTREKQYIGEGGQYVYKDAYEVVTNDLAETLAQARHFYEESVITAMKHDEWNGTPLCLDTVFGALAAALDDEEDARAARVAVEVDVTLDSCPRCSSRLETRDGARMCDDCGWHEEYNRLTQDHTPAARIDVDVATTEGGAVEGLVDRRLPSMSSLPDPSDVLILDATPRKDVYAAVFGVDPETVHVEGDDAYALPNATVTQFTNGAYHRGTLEESAVAKSKIQKALQKVSTIHDDVVYVSLKKVEGLFDWPETSTEDVLNYYALRGLDGAKDADAIVLVGAPHPAEDDLRAEGRLLALDNPGVRAGGRELSTRQNAPEAGPPIYRKLNYVDDGNGRAMSAKTYTGITGDLFDGRHADEIEQAAHRIRPLLANADDPKHIYLLTNVPTKLPVDRVTTFDDFLDPLKGRVSVRDSALELLGAMVEAARDDENDAPYATDGGVLSVAGSPKEWLDAAERAGLDLAERTVYAALDDLRDAGLVEEGSYAQRRGRLQTLTPLGASVASIRR